MVEKGATDLDDILKGRLSALKEERDRARAALAAEIAQKLIERFGPLMRTTVTRGEIPFRKAWLQAIVDRAEVDADAIRIIGDKASLEAAIIGGASSATPGVRSSVRKRRTRHDSNV
ncbi:hypothetical protein ACLBX9_02720 [Methylobacterium sp. A49B]